MFIVNSNKNKFFKITKKEQKSQEINELRQTNETVNNSVDHCDLSCSNS